MITRIDVIEQASMDCLKELYSKVQPAVDWDDFMQQNLDYSSKYQQWEQLESRPPIEEFCGPRPYEFYYLPKDIMKEIADSYVYAYNIDQHAELLNTIEILKKYCMDPVEEAYVEEEDGVKRRGYTYPNPLEMCIAGILRGYYDNSECTNHEAVARELFTKFTHYLDMAGNFYSWNRDINSFNTTVYLGPSPCSNKERVIANWKKYRNKDITIDESIYEDEED